MNKQFTILSLVSLLLIGCGSDSKSSSNTIDSSDNQTNALFQELRSYSDIVIIYRATKDFCANSNILNYIKNNNNILNYKMIMGINPIPECSDFSKTDEHCDTYIAEGEPGSINCVIGYNLR